jgi:uncharacterized membrane protein YbhN (UPF0104 family)
MNRRNRWFGVGARAAVSGLLICYVFSQVDLSAVGERLRTMSPLWSAAAIAMLLVQVLVVTQRWRIVLAVISRPMTLITAARLVMIGLFFNQTLPSAIGGDLVRIWKVRKLGVPLGKATNSVLLDRLSALAATGLFVAVCVPWLTDIFTLLSVRIALLGLLGLTALGFLMLLTLDLIPGPPSHWRLTRAIHALAVDARRIFGHRSTATYTVGLATVNVFISGLAVYVLSLALGIQVNLGHALILTPLVLLATMIPISLAGWGVREIGMVTALGAVGVPSEDALTVSLSFGLAVILVGLPGGLLWLHDHRPGEFDSMQESSDAGDETR